MDRRSFLVISVSAAGALVSPPQLSAGIISLPEAGTAESIDYVFQTMHNYGFTSLDAKAGLFSYYPYTFKNFDECYTSICKMTVDCGGRDHLDRIRFMMTISQKLEEQFGPNLDLHIDWLDQPNAEFQGKTPRALLSTLHYCDMARVARVLEEGAFS